jgi:hypothetical protein
MIPSVLNTNVSRFDNVQDVKPESVNLLAWLQSSEFMPLVQAVREATDKAERTKLKQQLPAITVSGLFERRNLDGLTKHSGLLCLDIDHQDNKSQDIEQLKTTLSKVQNFAYIGLSVSGNGLFCIVPIARPDKHKEHFQALQNDLWTLFNVIVDRSGSDISRLRFASHDSNPYYNHEATVYTKLPQQTQQKQKPQYRNCDKTDFQELINQVQRSGIDLTASYQAWFEIGCALSNEFGERGREYFHVLSQSHKDYNRRATDRQFNHCRKITRFRLNTIFFWAKHSG